MRNVRLGLNIPKAGSRPFDVAGFGLNSIDLLAVVAEYPASNTKQRLQRFMHLPGGQIATALTVCARLGWRVTYVGAFGSDDLGRMSRESLLEDHVDLSAARTVAGATNQFAVILVDARSGARTVLWDRHPLLTWEPADMPREAVTSGRMLLLDCHETAAATQAARYAREAGIPPGCPPIRSGPPGPRSRRRATPVRRCRRSASRRPGRCRPRARADTPRAGRGSTAATRSRGDEPGACDSGKRCRKVGR